MKKLLIKSLTKVEYFCGDIASVTDRLRRYFKGLRWRVEEWTE